MQRPVKQSELQEDIERYSSRLTEAFVEGMTPLEDADPKTHELALRLTLRYASSALEIASGPAPEVALFDMIVFVSLSRHSFEHHWAPHVFGERGQEIVRVLNEAEREIWKLAARVLTADQETELRDLIEDWIRQNPNRVRVEAVRFSDFAALAGRLSERGAKDRSGLFSTMKLATIAADDAVLLGQRALFIAHRVPFLLRMQARLAASEIVTDSVHRLDEARHLADRVPELRPLIDDASALARDSRGTALEVQSALHALEPVLARVPPLHEIQKSIGQVNELTVNASSLVGQLRDVIPGVEGAATVTRQAERLLRRAALYLALVGAAWSLFFWGGYYLVKHLRAEHPPPASVRNAPQDRAPVTTR